MREILFRGKRIDSEEWTFGHYCKSLGCLNGRVYDYHAIYDITLGGHNQIIPETLGQYTGLTDKNGKRIFEGDICRNTKTGEVVSVKWHGTFAGFVWSRRNDNGNLCDFGELFRAYDKYEVIGNIHDNPELIKNGEQNSGSFRKE